MSSSSGMSLAQARSSSEVVRGVLWGLFAISIWSGWMIITRLGVKTTLSAPDITALRFGSAGLLLVPVVWRQGLALDRLRLHGLLVLVGGAGASYVLVAATGMRFAPASHAAALIPGVMPVFVALLSVAVLGESISARRRVGFSLVLLGVITMVGWSLLRGGQSASFGHVLFLTASFMWAAFTVTMKRASLTPLHATAIVSVVSMVAYLPLYLLFVESRVPSAPVMDVTVQVLYQGLLQSVVSLIAYGRAVVLLGASRAATFAALVPVLAMLLGIPTLGEIPSAVELLAILVISLGVYWASRQ